MARPLTPHHVIDIAGSSEQASTSASYHGTHLNDMVFGVSEDFHVSHPSGVSNSVNSSLMRQGDTRGGRRMSPLNSGLFVSIELVLTLSQIVASVVVLCLSRDEHPRTPLFAWVVCYASGCVATLPLLYWRYYHGKHVGEQDSTWTRQNSPRNGGGDVQVVAASSGSNQASWLMNPRLKVFVEYFKMATDCFFAIWFVVGNVWIFGEHSSAYEAPNLYRLCIVFLTICSVGYAMPFILCVTICCCLPCIISVLGVGEDLIQTRGATSELINALPTYKFKKKKNKRSDESNSAGGAEGGVVAAGTEKERMISGEDAVCCICIGKYENNDELRELPCSHLFHKDCVDKWLKINALCPLCKKHVGVNVLRPDSREDTSQQHNESRVENDVPNASS